jgi:hypothetical protein
VAVAGNAVADLPAIVPIAAPSRPIADRRQFLGERFCDRRVVVEKNQLLWSQQTDKRPQRAHERGLVDRVKRRRHIVDR